jgi:hypothetical protein
MADNEPQSRIKNNQLARALSRWENEGGAAPSSRQQSVDETGSLSQEEEHILECLGAAVIAQWNELPTPVQRQLFQFAVSMGEPRQAAHLKELIARFLHIHKDDRRHSE